MSELLKHMFYVSYAPLSHYMFVIFVYHNVYIKVYSGKMPFKS